MRWCRYTIYKTDYVLANRIEGQPPVRYSRTALHSDSTGLLKQPARADTSYQAMCSLPGLLNDGGSKRRSLLRLYHPTAPNRYSFDNKHVVIRNRADSR